jgi:Ca2+/Na+ antiporter
VVSITAGLKRKSGIALGNAVGSAVCNIGLVLATTAKQFTVRPSEFASSFDSDASLRCGPVRDHARSSAVADPSSAWCTGTLFMIFSYASVTSIRKT